MLSFIRYDMKPVWDVPAEKIVGGSLEIVEEDIGSIQVRINTSGCCENIRNVVRWQTWVRFEDEYASFLGVVTSINDDKGLVTITAHDRSVFWKFTPMPATSVTDDVSNILAYLANLPFVDGAGFDINKKFSGVSLEREWLNGYVYVWDAIQDVLKANISYFVHGNRLFIYPPDDMSGEVLQLSNSDFADAPNLLDNGLEYADKVIVNGQVQAVAENVSIKNGYGVGVLLRQPLTYIVSDNNVKDYNSAYNVAQSTLLGRQNPLQFNNVSEVRLKSCSLLKDYLPSRFVKLNLTGYCLPAANNTYRIFKTTYDILGKRLAIVLKPIGEN